MNENTNTAEVASTASEYFPFASVVVPLAFQHDIAVGGIAVTLAHRSLKGVERFADIRVGVSLRPICLAQIAKLASSMGTDW